MTRALASLLLLPLLALSACGDDDATPRESPVASTSASPSASATPTPSAGPVDAAEVLALGGLTLPPNTSGVKAERVDATSMQWLEVYRVSFTAPRANALQICQTAGLSDVPSTRLPEADLELLGPGVTHVKGMRRCSGLNPEDSAWHRIAVITPDTPATVHVAVARMGR